MVETPPDRILCVCVFRSCYALVTFINTSNVEVETAQWKGRIRKSRKWAVGSRVFACSIFLLEYMALSLLG